MKIEYLSNTDPAHSKRSILRIFDFDTSEACQFRGMLSQLSDGSTTRIDLTDISFVKSIADCQLVLKVGKWDKGVIINSKNRFECVLTRDGWENAKDLVEPFCEGDSSGYQWLYDLYWDIELLFSPTGYW
jgi:hypothetical protein